VTSIEVRGLCKEFLGKIALKDINLRINTGEIFAIIGPNGAGKTTLLRLLNLLDEPSSGTILFNGVAVDYSPKKLLVLHREMSMVFQQTTLFNMKVFDNVAYGLRARDEAEESVKRKVTDALELVHLSGFEKKNALTLSGGEAQRIALAQVLVVEPNLLLLDEPTANLDPKTVSIIEEVLSWVNRKRRTTIVMATHNMFQAQTLAHRAALLLDGRIEKTGTIREIFEVPSKRLASFARLENVFSGVSSVVEEGTSLVDIGGGLRVEAAFTRSGEVMVYVSPEDIILSTHPIVSSARNNFKGRVIEVADLGPTVRLKVNAGRPFVVQITKRSFKEMQLNVDSEAFLTFKASSVQAV